MYSHCSVQSLVPLGKICACSYSLYGHGFIIRFEQLRELWLPNEHLLYIVSTFKRLKFHDMESFNGFNDLKNWLHSALIFNFLYIYLFNFF